MTHRTPAEVFPPGEYIQDELDARGLTVDDLAGQLEESADAIRDLIAGRRAVTPALAQALATTFGTSPDVWLNLEARYRFRAGASTPDPDERRRA
ncbi:MAG: HigA family addiction module antitoxin [Dehalococcoidia bacterium]|nr:HigA family addiction module antitoxin [Dehalococcoidia bacterium]